MKRIIRIKDLSRALLFLMLLVTTTAIAADKPLVGDGTLSLESIAALRATVEQDADLSDEQRKQAQQKLEEARAKLQSAIDKKADTKALKKRIRDAPKLLAEAREAQAVATAPPPSDFDPQNAVQLQTLLNETQAQETLLRGQLADSEKELSTFIAAARNGIRDIDARNEHLGELLESSSAPAETSNESVQDLVSRMSRESKIMATEAELAWLTLRQNNLDTLTDLSQTLKDAQTARFGVIQDRLIQLRHLVAAQRQREAAVSGQAIQEALSDVPPALASVREKIAGLIIEQTELFDKEGKLDQDIERVNRLLEQIGDDYERVQNIVEFGGGGAQASALLRKRLAYGPSAKSLTQQVIDQQKQLSEAVLRQIELDEQLRDSADGDTHVEKLIGDATPVADEPELSRLKRIAKEAWVAERKASQELWRTYNRYISKLSTLEALSRKLLQAATTYRSYIDDRLLWMPSTGFIPLTQPELLVAGIQWLIKPDHLIVLLKDCVHVLTHRVSLVLAWLLGLAVLIFLRPGSLRGLKDAALVTTKVRTDRFSATLAALGHTIVLILPLPWLFLGAGFILGRENTADEYSLSVAVGLQAIGHTLLLLEVLRQLCRRHGLARVHLPWHESLCNSLSIQAIWLAPLLTPVAFLVATSAIGVPSAFASTINVSQVEEPGFLALGRLAFVALATLLAIGIYRVWRKGGPVIQDLAREPDRATWANYHILWFAPALMLPFGLAVAALAGYYYSAVFLTGKIGETLWFVLALILLKDLLQRGLYVTQRRLRFQEALRHREEQAAQRSIATEGGSSEGESLPIEEEKINYNQLGDQVRQLVQIGYTLGFLAGLWWIWQDVIPAFGVLNTVELPITTSQLVDGETKNVSLTLGDMITGLLLGGLALFAARNIPALLELTLLQRLPLSRASRYALTTLTQYVVAIIGLVITFNALGLQWSSIQWLVAALSVGLGFGLQEIVANFVSGIILLFEQPIRIGDVVTVNGTSGTVARIRIRATTIVNWERQELVVPNKSFITGELINWTLSDTVNRLLISIGVDYGTDTRKAMQLIQQVAEDHPQVLADPPPRVTFENFGNDALTLYLRAYLNDIDVRLQTTTELHQAINDAFIEAGISIAYPQRDVHLYTAHPLELLVRREARTTTDSS